MKKKYYGPLFAQNMWAAAKSYTAEKYNYYMGKIQEKSPGTQEWLDEKHPYIWTRSKFSEDTKVDYINNSISESFNSWIAKTKDMQIVDMHDKIRQMILTKFQMRNNIDMKMDGRIISQIVKTLNATSKPIKEHDVLLHGHSTTKVTVSTIRHAVNLEQKTCNCRAWQVTGKPCNHVLAIIAKLDRDVPMDDFVQEYFSVERLRKAYAGVFIPMTSKNQWLHIELAYKIKKPRLRRKPGRPRVSRIKASDEVGTSKKGKCSECNELGHIVKYYQGGLTASQKKIRSSSHNVEVTSATHMSK
jgi:hypothetical protein